MQSASPARFTRSQVLLNATSNVKSIRVKVKSHEEVGHLNKVWLVILQGTQLDLWFAQVST